MNHGMVNQEKLVTLLMLAGWNRDENVALEHIGAGDTIVDTIDHVIVETIESGAGSRIPGTILPMDETIDDEKSRGGCT